MGGTYSAKEEGPGREGYLRILVILDAAGKKERGGNSGEPGTKRKFRLKERRALLLEQGEEKKGLQLGGGLRYLKEGRVSIARGAHKPCRRKKATGGSKGPTRLSGGRKECYKLHEEERRPR